MEFQSSRAPDAFISRQTEADPVSLLEQTLNSRGESGALVRARRFLSQMNSLATAGERNAIEEALTDIARLHEGQERAPGVPYYRHPLLVTILVTERFGLPFDATRSLVALYHDVPEDQFARVSKASGAACVSPEEAIHTLAERYASVASKERFAKALGYLTNPDFDVLVEALSPANSQSPHRMHAEKLFRSGVEACGSPASVAPGNFDTKSLKNLLYLGHFKEIRDESPEAFFVKLADFYCNGLHLHLMRSEEGSSAKAVKLTEKYLPVIDYLVAEFSTALAEGKAILGSARKDTWYLKKLEYVANQLRPQTA